MPKPKNDIAEYRNYFLPSDFPVLLLTGEHWKISNVPSKHLHFHNCLEIGLCHSESGYMEFNGRERLFFKEGDITCIPRNIPHTTYSSPNTESRWSYLFLNTQELFKNIAPDIRGFDLSLSAYKEYQHILSREEYPYIYDLTTMIIKEIQEQTPCTRPVPWDFCCHCASICTASRTRGATGPRSPASPRERHGAVPGPGLH